MECVYKKTGILFKLVPCLLALMIAIMTLYGSFVYATDLSVADTSNNNYTVVTNSSMDTNSEYPYMSVFQAKRNSQMGCYLLYSQLPITVRITANSYAVDTIDSSSNTQHSYNVEALDLETQRTIMYYKFLPFSSAVNGVLDFNGSFSDYGGGINFSFIPSDYVPTFLYSDHDIYNSSFDTLVFQVPTQEVGGIVATQIQPVEMNKTQQEIIAILPVILVVIVGLIALRKAIQFLIRLMKQQ